MTRISGNRSGKSDPGEKAPLKDLTTDSFFGGAVRVKQHRYGYRFSIDAVLLAHHVRPRPKDRLLDLGAGCGIIPLIVGYRYPDIHMIAVEIQPALARLAADNIRENRMQDRIVVLCEDLKRLNEKMISGRVEIVVSNPPYRKATAGRINPNRQRAVARHEIKAALIDVIEAARRMLHEAGRFVMIYPSERLTDALVQMRAGGIEPKILRAVHASARSSAKLMLIEGVKGGMPGTLMLPPVLLYRRDGGYTDEVEAMLSP